MQQLSAVLNTAAITINGKSYEGNNLIIGSKSGTITIDGNNITINDKVINIKVDGDIQSLSSGSSKTLLVNGNAGYLESTSGDVTVGTELTAIKQIIKDRLEMFNYTSEEV